MTIRISASMAQLSAFVVEPNPSAITWSRLEPLPTSDDIAESLKARVADPLWFLARQWQFNEFQGEDAGSPVAATLALQGLPVTTLLGTDPALPAQPLAGQPPIEALVEREEVLRVHPKLNAQAGQQLARQLRAAALDAPAGLLRAAFGARIADPADPVSDNAGFVWHRLLDAKAIDAQALASKLGPIAADDGQMAAFCTGVGIAAGDAPGVIDALRRWLAWLAGFVCEGSGHGASPYWHPQRLEYRFALGAEGSNPPLRLEAEEYTDGHLDWHTFTVGAGALQPNPPPAAVETYGNDRPLIPAIARYPGMPADRFWEFEDGRVSFGQLGAAKSDLARLAVLEYALVYGNDWFVLPFELKTNRLYRVADFHVRDNFGFDIVIPSAQNSDGTPWTLFELSVTPGAPVPRQRLDDLMYLCPSVETLEGPPLEHVLMMRDEMANLVWGIEKRVQGSSGEPLDRKFESTRLTTLQTLRPPAGAPAVMGAPLSYQLQTPVAANWIPFLPVRKKGLLPTDPPFSIQLQRAVVKHFYPVDATRLADPRNADVAGFIQQLRSIAVDAAGNPLQGAPIDGVPFVEATDDQQGPPENRVQGFMFHPRGSLLKTDPDQPVTADYLRLEEEEVPREGVQLQRAFNYARDAQGHALLWIGRSKTVGRGEGNSGLKFDGVTRTKVGG